MKFLHRNECMYMEEIYMFWWNINIKNDGNKESEHWDVNEIETIAYNAGKNSSFLVWHS